jgi:hypothetical protein
VILFALGRSKENAMDNDDVLAVLAVERDITNREVDLHGIIV